jgi:putative flippase GtrA
VSLPRPARARRAGWRLALKELSGFGTVGACAFVIDVSLFQLLYVHAGLGAVTAKVLGTAAATTAAYVGHRYWSFAHRSRPGVRREYVTFVLINGGTLLLSTAVVAFVRYPLGHTDALILQAANVAAIAAGTVLRYIAYRRWVFPAAPADGARSAARLPEHVA